MTGGFSSWLEQKNAGSTRSAVANAIRTNLRRSTAENSLERRLEAIVHALRTRAMVFGHKESVERLTFEATPFSFLNDDGAIKIVAEYVLWKELPSRSNSALVEHGFRAGMEHFLSDSSEQGMRLQAYFLAMLDRAIEEMAWARWTDEELFGRIFDVGQAAIKHLELDKQ